MSSETKKPLVLLVEDSDDDAFFFERALRKSGASCCMHHSLNGAEAIDFLRKATRPEELQALPHTIFLDLKMPLVNGFEVLSWMQSQDFSTPIPVIVLSGSDHHQDKERANELGAADYLVKPVKAADLARHLETICPPEIGPGAQR